MPQRRSSIPFAILGALLAAGANAVCTSGATPLRVPEDCALLGDAVAAIADGGTIDIAAGTYTFGGQGLDLSGKNRAMTLRARSTGNVVFSGQTTGAVARISNGATNGKPIVFEGIRFVDGFSSTANRAGGVTMLNAVATFADCSFENNRMTEATTGGGALGLYGNSTALVVRTTFLGNSATNDGGAIYLVKGGTGVSSVAWLHDSTLQGNRAGKAGGAIYLRDGKVRIADTVFDTNLVDFVGGAIYAYGTWTGSSPWCNFSAPAADVLVARSYFFANRADDDTFTSKSVDGHTEAGAAHVENCARIQVFQSLFEQNEATFGGALNSFHGRIEVADTVFRANRAVYATSAYVPAGGAINAMSVDSTPDYPSAVVSVTGSLFKGEGSARASAQTGGCIRVSGDVNHANVTNPNPRAQVTISGSAFDSCSVAALNTTKTPVTVAGGAIFNTLAATTLTNVLIANGSANGGGATDGIGGGATFSNNSTTSFSNTVFSNCTSDGPYTGVRSDTTSTSSGSFSNWSGTSSSPTGGILLAVPSRLPAPSSAFTGKAYAAFAWSGSSATLDGSSLGNPHNGVVEKLNGTHTLAVSGLSNLTATIGAPISPTATLDASATSIAAGSSTTLSWTTPAGTFLTSLVDQGLGERAASGNATVAPLGTTTYRRLAVTKEGGALAERTVSVTGSAPPPPPPPSGSIFADGFEGGSLAAWSAAVP